MNQMAQVEYTATKTVCDICGADADGYWYRREEVNGTTNRLMIPPIDLCATHAMFFDSDSFFTEYVVLDRERNTYPQEKSQELIDLMKSKWGALETWQQTKFNQ